jgi:ureidoglycolate lyase
MPISLKVVPLTRSAFRRFGDVLDASGPADAVSNAGAARIYRERAEADFGEQGAYIGFNVVRTAPRSFPIIIDQMERHPLGAQMFAPLIVADWLVVVAPVGALEADAVVAFRVLPGQAVNYRRGVWHSPLIALGQESDFLVIERVGESANLDLEPLDAPFVITSLEN